LQDPDYFEGVNLMVAAGFDNQLYLQEQTAAILARVEASQGKLYLEFGGKLTDDQHAARVLPGYDPDVKMRLLQGLEDRVEVIFCVNTADVTEGRIRGDYRITYDMAIFRALDDLHQWGIPVTAVVLTRWQEGSNVHRFERQLAAQNIPFHRQFTIPGYPNEVDLIVSDEGYGRNMRIPTTAPLVVVTGPGPASGKMATCLSQLYHDYRCGQASGYAKFETFPIWNLPLEHPVNVAYEAATVELNDRVLIDPFHLEAYGQTCVNYNRDIESFPILKAILQRITSLSATQPTYRSPTDMGVNRAAAGIIDDALVREASRQEVIRRYFRHRWEARRGLIATEVSERAEQLMLRLSLSPTDRPVVEPARLAASEAERAQRGNEGFYCGAALQLPDETLITGKNSPLLHSASAAVINAIKHLAGIPPQTHLLPASVVESLTELKRTSLGSNSPSLNVQELLIALGISAANDDTVRCGLKVLKGLHGLQMHLTHEPGPGDEVGLRKLGIILTTDATPTRSGYFLP
jgi:uncharacterized protein (UPF0371 family)